MIDTIRTMKITKVLSRAKSYYMFFRILGTDYTICEGFTRLLIGTPLDDVSSVKITLSTKNPKKKGFKKIHRGFTNANLCDVGFEIISKQRHILDSVGIKEGDYFWMKGEIVN